MIDELFFKYPYQDEEDFLTECDCCQSADEKCDLIDDWFYTQDDFEDYIDEVDYLMGLPNDEETVIRSNGLLYLHDLENNVCTLLGFENNGRAELIVPSAVCGIPVSRIAADAFSFNQEVQYVELPSSVVQISAYAFIGCTHLHTVKLGAKQMQFGKAAFYKCHSLRQVLWEDSLSSWFHISFANEFSNPLRCGAELICNGERIENLIIPDGIVVIPQGAFTGCSSIKTVQLPSSVKRIGRAAFAFCENLKTIDSREYCAFSVFREVFFNCFSLNSVWVEGCFSIGAYAFGNCRALNQNNFQKHFMYMSEKALKGVENE